MEITASAINNKKWLQSLRKMSDEDLAAELSEDRWLELRRGLHLAHECLTKLLHPDTPQDKHWHEVMCADVPGTLERLLGMQTVGGPPDSAV